MFVTLYTFTGGCREFADEITSSVHTTRAGADAAMAAWLDANDDADCECDDDADCECDEFAVWHGYVSEVVIDISDAVITSGEDA
jgi:hypothetical protein